MTVLVVGGTGFIGSAIATELHRRGETPIRLDIDPTGSDTEGMTTVSGDVTEYESIVAAMKEYRPTRVINVAYMLASAAERSPNDAIRTNCLGVDNVFKAADETGVDRVVLAGSIAAYGAPDEYREPVQETAMSTAAYADFPLMHYSATKQLNEFQAKHYHENTSISVVSIRPSIVFGPSRTAGLSQWASSFVTNPANERNGEIPLKPEQRLNMVYYRDVARLFAEVTLADEVLHTAYNTGGHRVTVRELADTVERVVGGTVSCDPNASPLRLVGDVGNTRATSQFGYCLTPLAEALRDHADAV